MIIYVSNVRGDDTTGDGSFGLPYKTLTKAEGRSNPGDIIYAEAGVYNEKYIATKSGLPGQPITLTGEPGAVIDGTGLPIKAEGRDEGFRWFDGLLHFNNISNYKIVNLEIRNYKTYVQNEKPAGIFFEGHFDNIEILGNNIHDICNLCDPGVGVDWPVLDAHAIGIYGTSIDTSHNIRIQGNEIHDCHCGCSEVLVINANIDGYENAYNNIHDCDNIAIDNIGYEGKCPISMLDRARNGWNHHNRIDNVNIMRFGGNPAYRDGGSLWGFASCSDGIYHDGSTNIVTENNIISRTDFGVECGCEHRKAKQKGMKYPGPQKVPFAYTENIVVRNNFIFNGWAAGIIFGGYDKHRGIARNIEIYNNTVYNGGEKSDGWGEGSINHELFIQMYTEKCKVYNNIFISPKSDTGRFVGILDNLVKMDVDFDNNCYWCTDPDALPEWKYDLPQNPPQTVNTFEEWQWAGKDVNGMYADPMVVAVADFDDVEDVDLHLQPSSPCRDRGSNSVAYGTTDIDDEPRKVGVAVDCGADELQV